MLDCIIQRLTAAESQLYIRDKLKVEVGVDYIKKTKSELKKSAEIELKHLQQDHFGFIQLFFDRVEEIKYLQRKQWEIINNNPNSPDLHLACMKELHSLTISLADLYDVLPAVVSTRPNFDSGNYEPDHNLKTKLDSRDLDPSERIF